MHVNFSKSSLKVKTNQRPIQPSKSTSLEPCCMKRDYFQWWVGTATQPKPPLHGNAQRCQTGCLGGRVKILIDTNYHSKTNKPCLWQNKNVIQTFHKTFGRRRFDLRLHAPNLISGKLTLTDTDWNVRPTNQHEPAHEHFLSLCCASCFWYGRCV